MSGATQVGQFVEAATLRPHASMWSDTPESRVDLNPVGVNSSVAAGCFGNEQVGHILNDNTGDDNAGLWHGTAASWVNLHPTPIARHSRATGTDGVHQVGYIGLASGFQHGAMWSGSAASFVDMNPPGARGSGIFGIGGNQQVGAVYWSGVSNGHAALWSGTPGSVIDLHPVQAGTGYSGLLATDGVHQVGGASIGSFAHAGIWSGTAASFVDLHALLPAGYGASAATSVEEYQGQTWVGGYVINGLGNREAFLWVGVPAPGTGLGIVAAGVVGASRRRRLASPSSGWRF